MEKMNTIVVGIAPTNNMFPAGYYSREQRGSHDSEHVIMWYNGTDEEDVEGIPFCYWEEEFPVTEDCYPWE